MSGAASLLILAAGPAFAQVVAVDHPWDGTTGPWLTATNWTLDTVPTQAAGQVPVIANNGVAQISATVPLVGALRLGSALTPVAPDNGTGTLEISAGTLRVATAVAPAAANGPVNIGTTNGAANAGILRMTGGTLQAGSIEIGQNAANLVELSGAAIIDVNGNAGMGGTTRITGSAVQYTALNLNMRASAVFAPVITSNTTWSTLKTKASGAATINGTINVNFVGVTPPIGSTWSLVEGAAVVGNFTNNGNVPVSFEGVAATLPTGEAYRTRVVNGGAFGRKLELVHDNVLVLRVNRETGIATIENPAAGALAISTTAYNISSAAGSLSPSTWSSLADQGTPGFQEGNATAFRIGDLNPTSSLNVTAGSTRSLGKAYDDGAAFFSNGIGAQGNDLIFEYLTQGTATNGPLPAGEIIRGQVIYEGVAKTNTLLLTINQATGAATLKNDSPGTITIDGFSVLSTGGALVQGNFAGLGKPELTTVDASANAVSQLAVDPNSPLRIASGETFNLGSIFAVGQPTTGFSLEFTTPGPAGDYNLDGRVDGSDFVIWQRTLGTTVASGTGADGNNNGTVDAGDLTVWKNTFGMPRGSATAIYNGVVRFEGGAIAAVPEPAASMLILAAIGSAGVVRRRRGGSGA